MPLTQVSSRAIEDTLRYVLGANGTSDYTFTGPGLSGAVNDPTLTLSRGHTYIFENRSGGHPFYIKTSIANGGTNDAYNTGVTNNGGGNGTEIVFTVPHDAPDLLYYQCSSHSSMAGQLKIAGAIADGSITTAKLAADAVDGTKIADDAINSEHLVADSIDAEHYAAGSVDTTAIADEAVTLAKLPHGDTNNDGKFLRANNGADPSFETVSIPAGTTIQSNAEDRLITGSGTANQVNAEDSGFFSNGQLKILTDASSGSGIRLVGKSGNSGSEIDFVNNADNSVLGYIEFSDAGVRFWNQTNTDITFRTNNTERLRILAGGGLTFNGDTAAANALDDYEEGTFSLQPVNGWGILNGGALNPANAAISEGKYVRIGAIVYIYCCYSEGGSSGASFNSNRILFTGLPFNADTDGTNTSNVQHIIFGANYNINSSDGMGMFMTPSTSGHSVASIYRQQTGGRSDFTGSSMGSTGKLWFSGSYRINGT